MNSPPVPVVSPPEPPQPLTLVCANCHGTLTGEYCAECGQRHEPHIHTVAHFAGEAFESISHADSRLWRTLWYLLTRPGFLTREFFHGKRVRYLPPFRLYLVISVLFFVVVGLPEGAAIRIDVDGVTATSTERVEKMEQTAAELRKDAGPASGALALAADALERQAQAERAALDPDPDAAGDAKPRTGLAKTNGFTEFCDSFKKADPTANSNYERLRKSCAKIGEDGGAELGRTVVHNIPKAMFVFLPLLALGMKLLYWRPKRYYVEHLLFLIHNHAFVFLSLALLTLVKMIPVVGDHVGLLEAFIWLYLLWYLYRAMRNVYQQSRGLTLLKYFAIGFFYVCAAVTVLLLTTLYSAMIAA
jgi:hypothetical protein